MQAGAIAIFLFVACLMGVAVVLLVMDRVFSPGRPGRVKRMPYESGMDPVHDTRRRFDVRFHLLAIAFLVFDVELLFLYPWAVVVRSGAPAAVTEVSAAHPPASQAAAAQPAAPPARSAKSHAVFIGGMVFVALLALGFIYDWGKGIFQWR